MEMANLRGNDIKLHSSIPFSLFISSEKAVRGVHAIRVKVLWNPNKMTATPDGELQLHGSYDYKVYSHKYKPTSSELSLLKNYCKKYKVLFAAIWESILDPTDFIHYQEGLINFKELLTKFDLSGKNYYLVNHCNNVEELESCIRENKIFNLWD